jgi:hypothetical protein
LPIRTFSLLWRKHFLRDSLQPMPALLVWCLSDIHLLSVLAQNSVIPETSSFSTTWELVVMQILRSHPWSTDSEILRVETAICIITSYLIDSDACSSLKASKVRKKKSFLFTVRGLVPWIQATRLQMQSSWDKVMGSTSHILVSGISYHTLETLDPAFAWLQAT